MKMQPRLSGTDSKSGPASAAELDQPEPIAQPLKRGPGHEDAPLEREDVVRADAPGDGREQTRSGVGHRPADVDEEERAGAVRVLGHTGLDACLAEQGCLLVARDPADRRPDAEEGPWVCRADRPGARMDCRQDPERDAEERAELGVEIAAGEVVEEGPARVARVGGDDGARGEPCDEPGVDRARADLTAFGTCGQRSILTEQPLEFRCREVRVEQQPGPAADLRLLAAGAVLRADPRAAPALPDDGGCDRLERPAVEDHERLALVGDADRGRLRTCLAEQTVDCQQYGLPELDGVLLDPPLVWMADPHVAMRPCRDVPVGSHEQTGRPGGALIDRKHQGFAHDGGC